MPKKSAPKQSNKEQEFSNKLVDYLGVSKSAEKEIIKKIKNKPEYLGIKICIKKRGCSGLAYNIEFATNENIEATDEKIDHKKVNIFVDPQISFMLFGAILDFVEKKTKDGLVVEAGFVFTNPNESGRCGCGESFFL
jgi:iron-sulfur cluster assembly accessory protein